MLAADRRVQIVDTEVVARVFDGEAIVINVATGKYYSLDRVGTLAWHLLTGGATLQATAAGVAAHYGLAAAAVAGDVQRLANQLLAEGLVTTREEPTGPAPVMARAPAPGAPYAPPTLTVYTDMTDVLALDPPLPEIREDEP